jgi:hypothetical protein
MRSMAIDRRTILKMGLKAGAAGAFTLLVPIVGARADMRPAYVATRREADGSFAAIVIDETGEVLFRESLDGRGHDIALSPDRSLAVFFARRPGYFALVVDLDGRQRKLAFTPPPGKHFYGHGFFAPDGRLLYVTESGGEDETGLIGVYDVAAGFVRIGGYPTHGLDPHEALLLPDGKTMVVANGGMQTHPDDERLVINLATMEPSLAYIDIATGDLVEQVSLGAELHQVSLRHMGIDRQGAVWIGGQYQGPPTDEVPLVVRHRLGRALKPIPAPAKVYASLRQYVGSVSANADGSLIATTSPRGGTVIEWNAETGAVVSQRALADVCGVAPEGDGFLVSDGMGQLTEEEGLLRAYPRTAWDNHLRKV